MLQAQALLSTLTISVLKTAAAQGKPYQEHDHTIHLFILTAQWKQHQEHDHTIHLFLVSTVKTIPGPRSHHSFIPWQHSENHTRNTITPFIYSLTAQWKPYQEHNHTIHLFLDSTVKTIPGTQSHHSFIPWQHSENHTRNTITPFIYSLTAQWKPYQEHNHTIHLFLDSTVKTIPGPRSHHSFIPWQHSENHTRNTITPFIYSLTAQWKPYQEHNHTIHLFILTAQWKPYQEHNHTIHLFLDSTVKTIPGTQSHHSFIPWQHSENHTRNNIRRPTHPRAGGIYLGRINHKG